MVLIYQWTNRFPEALVWPSKRPRLGYILVPNLLHCLPKPEFLFTYLYTTPWKPRSTVIPEPTSHSKACPHPSSPLLPSFPPFRPLSMLSLSPFPALPRTLVLPMCLPTFLPYRTVTKTYMSTLDATRLVSLIGHFLEFVQTWLCVPRVPVSFSRVKQSK